MQHSRPLKRGDAEGQPVIVGVSIVLAKVMSLDVAIAEVHVFPAGPGQSHRRAGLSSRAGPDRERRRAGLPATASSEPRLRRLRSPAERLPR